jgi:uncharacterized membrane protein
MNDWFDPAVLLVALGMGAITYSLRLGGLMLGERLPRHGRWAYVMDRLPAIIVVAIVSSGLIHAGWRGWVAGAVTAGLSLVAPGLLIPMGAGVVVIAALRWLVV